MRFARSLAVATMGALLAGCGGSGSEPEESGDVATDDRPGATTPVVGAPPAEAPTNEASPGAVPAVEVRDVHTGHTVDLASLVPADQPILLWFWAPH